MDDMLLDQFVRLLDDMCGPARVRALEAGEAVDALWAGFADSGFLDALVPETAGGAGLSLGEVAPLLGALGAHAVPVPVAETMIARALLGAAGIAVPEGPIVLADLSAGRSGLVPGAMLADHALADMGDRLALFDRTALEVHVPMIHGSFAATFEVSEEASRAELARPDAGLAPVAAVARAAQIAGAAGRVLDMTVAYAGERTQFGKPIGRQQAVQQNLAVMAEEAVMAHMAARIGCAEGLAPRLETAAIAKQVTSAAALRIANIAHAVHGAIGISAEYELQLLTRRLHEWRMADGAESRWAGLLGARRLAGDTFSSIDYIRGIAAV